MARFESEFIEGARAGFAMLQAIETLDIPGYTGPENDPYGFDVRDLAIASILERSGIADPRQAGFLAAFAEYVFMVMIEAGVPNLGKWMPDASMTKEQFLEEREAFKYQMDHGDDFLLANNVVHGPWGRP